MAEQEQLERTEWPSPRRLEKAREEGQVARSRELATFLMLGAAAVGALALGGTLYRDWTGLVRAGLSFGRAEAFETAAMARLLGDLARAGLLSAAPLLALVALCGAAAFLMLGGWTLSTKAFAPDAARLNPVRLVKNVFSVRGLGELVKAILKALVLGGLAAWALHLFLADITGLAALPLATSVQHALRVIGWSWLVLVGGLALIAAVDVPFELWRHYSGLKMSRREVRDELKETEGDPQIRARVRSAQRDAARRRMMAAVPKADVIVTNPTHFAVALAYTETMRAPRVVAKGADLLAARIRELGVTHGVPTLEAPALARALYRHVPLEREVPQALYEAVALVMAYVFQLRAGRGGALPPPAALPVPQALDPGVQA